MRDFRRLIWHSTATPPGRDVSLAEIDRWHRDRGWKGVGYHGVVMLDGRFVPARPLDQVGAHVWGHNLDSIGYAYVGGADGQDTRTMEQKITMRRVTLELVLEYGVSVLGHRDVAATLCPGFDAAREYHDLEGYGLPPGLAVER